VSVKTATAGIQRFLHRSILEPFLIIRESKWALAGLIILLFFLAMATVGPYIVPMSAHLADKFQYPSLAHPLGTDYAGRDVLAQIVHGSRDVLSIAFLAAIFAVSIAIVVGILAGWQGGNTDRALTFFTNVAMTLPRYLVMIVLAVAVRVRHPLSLAVVLGFWSWAELARALRSQVLSLKRREFIEAAQAAGLSTFHIVFRELLPNVMSLVVIHFVTIMTDAVTASVALMLMGLVPFSPTNWGMMMNLARWQTGAIYVPRAIGYVLAPMVAIALFQLGGVLFSHGLDEVLDPRLRRS